MDGGGRRFAFQREMDGNASSLLPKDLGATVRTTGRFSDGRRHSFLRNTLHSAKPARKASNRLPFGYQR
jgi:hypothetical protein